MSEQLLTPLTLRVAFDVDPKHSVYAALKINTRNVLPSGNVPISKLSKSQQRRIEAYETASKDASLGVGRVWTNTACPAYRSFVPNDCVCTK